uniref:C2H2-type domain-containing protein n=1 Tax=Scylla olivacea TaxID=85551 RepID=A0A0P4W2H1_SCYOL
MSAREGTRRRRISILHMLGTWEEKIEGCNCPSCKECSGKGKPEAAVAKSPSKSPKGPKSVVKKGSPKSKVTDNEASLEENSAQNSILKEVASESETGDSVSESAVGEKSGSLGSDKLSDTTHQNSGDSGETETVSVHVESGAQASKLPEKTLNSGEHSFLRKESIMEGKLKQKGGGGTSKTIVRKTLKSPRKSATQEEDIDDQSTNVKQKRVADEMLIDSIVIKEEPEEYLSDLDDSDDKPARAKCVERGKAESRSSRRARMVTSEMENIYAKPRMIFTGRGVVRKFEPGIDRTPKSKRGRKPGKALLPINIKQEPKENEVVKQEVEGTDLDELQKALSEAAENISDVGEELLDAFNEFGEATKKIKPKKKAAPFFKRVEGEGDKYVECNICFKVLKESSMKQHYKTHTGEKPHMCDICQSRFTRKGDVERHKRLVHKSQKPFKCQKCMKEFSDRKNLKAHLQNHDKAIYYGCSTCGFKFGKREYYENHIRYIHPLPDGAVPAFSAVDDDLATKQLKQLEMEELKERNPQKSNINQNRELELEELEEEDNDDDEDMDEEDKAIEITVTEMDEQKLFSPGELMIKKEDSMDGESMNTQEEDEDEEEEEEEMSEHADAIKHELTVKEEPAETAEATADVSSDGRIDLNFYLQQAIQSASMPCPLCKKEFKSQSGLRDHIRLHTGERPFECEFCQMNFARASHLKRHRRMHTGEKPFMCRICGKDFSRGDKLKDHLRRHDAEDKLSKIRKQIYSPDETGGEGESEGQAGGVVGAAASQILTSKSGSSGPEPGLMPPAKRPRGRPPKNPQAHAQYQQAMTQVPSMLVPQSENYMPHMLGVTSIGECILRPIN